MNLRMIALLAAVAAFQLWAASRYTVFDDEAFSCLRYTLPMGEMIAALWRGDEPDPPLYYIAQNVWVRIFGVGPLALRGLSIGCFLAGLILLRQAAMISFGKRAAGWTLVIAALHPAHLFFGFAGRWYAAMFCMVALLLYLTAKIEHQSAVGAVRRHRYLAWSMAATAVCYANYFGPVVAGLVWLVGLRSLKNRGQWVLAGLAAVLLYVPWLPAFWRQVTTFPRGSGEPLDYLMTSVRTLMALGAGNLASVRAAWVWMPLAVAGTAMVILIVQHRRRMGPLLVVAAGCFIAGVATRVMIDKYVMTFSGSVCLLAAGAAAEAHRAGRRTWPRVAGIALAIAWIGCGANMVAQKYWSSLRWLDPFEAAIAEIREDEAAPDAPDWVITHPSGRYYAGLSAISGPSSGWRVDPARWRYHALADKAGPATPERMLERIERDPPSRVLTMHTSAFAEDEGWRRLEQALSKKYRMTRERSYLEDPDAALKDRVDPEYAHAPWRITVRFWQKE